MPKKLNSRRLLWVSVSGAALLLAACSSAPTVPELASVPSVDLPRFMGDWYVIAHVPPFIEKDARDSVESYRLGDDGTIAISFRYRNAPDAPLEHLASKGFVRNAPANSVWGIQFIWPIKADYRITYLAPDYGQTIISRDKRDYVWIMARTPRISDRDYERLVAMVRDQGYDVAKLRKVPQEGR